MAPLLRLQTGVSARGVYEGDDGAAEFLGLAHQTLGLAVTLGRGHTEVAFHVFFKVAPLPVADHRDRLSVEPGNGPKDAGVLPAQPVSLADKDVGKQVVDEVHGAGAAQHTGDLHPLGGS